VRHAGYLDGFELSRAEAEAMIMAARVHAGWVEAPPPEEAQEGDEGEESAAAHAEGEEHEAVPVEEGAAATAEGQPT
jgi:N utilization substance protein A